MAATQSYRAPTVYESTASGLPALRPYFTELRARRRFIWHLARTDLKAEHYDSAIGQLWVILDPLLLAAVYYLLRVVVKPVGTGGNRNAIIAHLLWGVFVFTFVSNTMMAGARSLLNGRQLILNASFPRAALPIVSVIKGIFDFVPTLFVYFVFAFILGQPFAKSLVFLPLIVVLLTIMTLGLGLLLAPLMVFYRDTGGFLPYATRIWLYITPVLYSVIEIPPRMVPLPALESPVPVLRGARADLRRAPAVTRLPPRVDDLGSRVLLLRGRRLPGAGA